MAGKPVLWVEGDPRLFPELVKAIAPYPTQRALQALLGRENLDSVQFHIANNNGLSSSIFPLAPSHGFEGIQLKMIDSITLPLVRLDSLISAQEVADLSHWVVDLQGAELEALVGAGDLLQSCLSMEIEVSKRRVYDGGVYYSQLESFRGKTGLLHSGNRHEIRTVTTYSSALGVRPNHRVTDCVPSGFALPTDRPL